MSSTSTPLVISAPVPSPRDNAEDPVVTLLRAGIPLSLLMDLASSDPHSSELYSHERAS